MTIQVGRPLAAAAPIPEETSPSIPLAPRLARKLTSASRSAARTPPGRGSACSRPCRRGRRPRSSAPRARVSARLGRLVRAPRARASMAAAAAAPASSQAAPLLPAAATGARRAPPARAPGSARTIAPAGPSGSFQPTPGSTTICAHSGARRATGAAACRSASRRTRMTSSGASAVGPQRGRSRRRRRRPARGRGRRGAAGRSARRGSG